MLIFDGAFLLILTFHHYNISQFSTILGNNGTYGDGTNRKVGQNSTVMLSFSKA